MLGSNGSAVYGGLGPNGTTKIEASGKIQTEKSHGKWPIGRGFAMNMVILHSY